jgi:NO-binding membrane sensor protein with MHYT domain
MSDIVILAGDTEQTGHVLHHFEMGHWVIGLAYGTSVIGSVVGLACAQRAGLAVTARYRFVWRLTAAASIGGVGIWLMHFIAMLGFAVPGSAIRYEPWHTGVSAVLAIAAVYAGLALAGQQLQLLRLAVGGVVMGTAIALMHYTGMAAIRFRGTITEAWPLVIASIAIAVVAATTGLWFTLATRSLAARIGAAAVLGVAVVGMHFTGMVAIRVDYDPTAAAPDGWDVFDLLFPVFILSFLALAIPITALMIAPDQRDPALAEAG